MALLTPYSKIPELNTATLLLVENEEQFQCRLADAIVQREKDVNVNVRLARKLPLPVENGETRPRIDLVVFIVNLLSEQSFLVVENSLNHLSSDYFLGKVCFVVTSARCGAVSQERLLSVRKLAASHRCPVICAEHQTDDGVTMAATRLLTILKVSAGLSPMPTTALYMSTLTRCTVPSDLDED
ncbi:centromere protein M [Astyanax mexicanus]|uniref:Centromere protein M n=2 Tax=Astyanax mexicanus TaxID=7994 RepID=A0A8B9JEE7_ASTMX|nr:centromere protein M [Astyanax mexicanus]KAG9262688.1 centromere protein M [Astyanax mexicanus]